MAFGGEIAPAPDPPLGLTPPAVSAAGEAVGDESDRGAASGSDGEAAVPDVPSVWSLVVLEEVAAPSLCTAGAGESEAPAAGPSAG